jgi:hypothetical protein
MLEKSKLAQHAYKEGQKICWKECEGPADWAKRHLQEIQGIHPRLWQLISVNPAWTSPHVDSHHTSQRLQLRPV